MINAGISASIIAIACLFYAYFGYALVLLIITKLRSQKFSLPEGESQNLKLTLIITAYNEERRIKEKLENTVKLEYPAEQLQIIVASDGSDDKTEQIAQQFDSVEVLRVEGRVGKEATQLEAVKRATGDVVVFTDVSTSLKDSALRRIAKIFSEPKIGAVSSVDRFVDQDGNISGEGLYVRYEMWLRDLETEFGSLVGLSGSFFACRKSVCQDWNSEVPSDFGTAIRCRREGLRAVSDNELEGFYQDVADPGAEYARKVRTILRGINGLRTEAKYLNPFRYGSFSFQLFSHKVMRWSSPIWMMVAFVGSAIAAWGGSLLGVLLVAGQVAFYLIALLPSQNGVLKIPRFFCMTNLAILRALIMSLSGVKQATWKPSIR